jgi:hypothetical protein
VTTEHLALEPTWEPVLSYITEAGHPDTYTRTKANLASTLTESMLHQSSHKSLEIRTYEQKRKLLSKSYIIFPLSNLSLLATYAIPQAILHYCPLYKSPPTWLPATSSNITVLWEHMVESRWWGSTYARCLSVFCMAGGLVWKVVCSVSLLGYIIRMAKCESSFHRAMV